MYRKVYSDRWEALRQELDAEHIQPEVQQTLFLEER